MTITPDFLTLTVWLDPKPMENLPWYVYVAFIATAALALALFIRAAHYSKLLLIVLAAVIAVQSFLGINGFYNDPSLMTRRFPLLIFPFFIFLISYFFTRRGRAFIDNMDLRTLTIFQSIRIFIEIVLLSLYFHHTIPQAMTFEGRNLDILSGITAPLVYYFGFVKDRLGKTVIILWNLFCILLLLNVVSSAVFSLPGRYQIFGFEQPNIAVGYFPFLLLPAIIVPMALFANVASIRILLFRKSVR